MKEVKTVLKCPMQAGLMGSQEVCIGPRPRGVHFQGPCVRSWNTELGTLLLLPSEVRFDFWCETLHFTGGKADSPALGGHHCVGPYKPQDRHYAEHSVQEPGRHKHQNCYVEFLKLWSLRYLLAEFLTCRLQKPWSDDQTLMLLLHLYPIIPPFL